MFEEIIWMIFVFGFIGILIPVILSIVSLVKISNLKDEIKKLKKRGFDLEKMEGESFEVKNERLENKNIPRYVVGQNSFSEVEEKSEEEKHESEFNIGSKWLTTVGVVSVIFGVGFFLDYAFSNNLISESGRVILGFISGIIFVILGDKFKNKLKDYSHYLMGGGFALVMLSAYFGLEYNLYSNAVAFGLMLVTVYMAGFLAHRLDSKILAGTTILAGFLAPVLASSGVANEIVLFNYILILLGGMFWLVFKHDWSFLIWGSLLGTVILYGGSMVEYYDNSVFWIYWIYLIIFFVIFAAAPVYSYFTDKEKGIKNYMGNIFVSILGGGIFIVVSYFMFELKIKGEWFNNYAINGIGLNAKIEGIEIFKNFYWVIGLIPSLVYLWLSKVFLKLKSKENILLYLMIGMATFSIAMIPALQFSGKWITFAWLVEAVILGYIFFKNNIKIFLNLGIVVLVAGLFRLLFIDSFLQTRTYTSEFSVFDFTPILNERALIYLIGVISIFSITYFAFYKKKETIAKWLGAIGNLFILFWIYLELNSWSSGYETVSGAGISDDTASLLLSVSYLLYGGILIWIGILKKYVGFRMFGLGLISFVILKTYLVDIWDFEEITRILAFVILGIFVLIISFYYSKISENLKGFLKVKKDE